MTEPSSLGRDTLKRMFTDVFETVKTLEVGKLSDKIFSSGNADAKFQSSSIDDPLVGFTDAMGTCTGWVFGEKSKSEAGDV